MARKNKKQNLPQKVTLQNTTQIDTDQFVKGMIKDTSAGLLQAGNWSHAINAINNSAMGDAGVIGNEPANLHCVEIPYTVIGGIHLYGDKWVMFATNDQDSEIGLFDDSHCTYERIIRDRCLSFDRKHLITGAAKENFDCTWQIYWDDGLNPSRTLNIDNVPYIQQQVGGPDIDGSPCVIYADATPRRLDCERIRLAPIIDVPCIELSKAKDGGMLRNGSYQAFLAYVVNEQKVTDYISASNLQPIFEYSDGQGSLLVSLSNLDTRNFRDFELVICSQIKGEASAKSIGIYSTEENEIVIDFINPELVSVGVELLPLRNPAYEKSDKMYVVNDYLIRSGPTEQEDFNYQPIANQIQTRWVSVEYPANYYKNGGNKPTFMRDEQYAFFIRWIYNTGEKSKSYHIPGRAPDSLPGLTGTVPDGTVFGDMYDTIAGDPTTGAADAANSLGTEVNRWETSNTAVEDTAIVNGTAIGTVLPDGGIVRTKGWMGYWESTEQYPMEPAVWDQLCGVNIRHHKFPDEQTKFAGTNTQSNFTQRNSDGTVNPGDENQNIYILGVEFDNVFWPRDIRGLPITNVVGYEILVGSRDGNRSIIAKGLGRNMQNYRIDNSGGLQAMDSEGGANVQGVIPNYPFNDVGTDPYLKVQDYFTGGITLHGTVPGTTARQDMFTFHSPETSINRIFLNPSEIKHYGFTTGYQVGKFKKSEDHPQNKLIRDVAVMIAAIIGGGYAIQQLQGEKRKKQEGARALSLNQDPQLINGGGGAGAFVLLPTPPGGGGGGFGIAPIVTAPPLTAGQAPAGVGGISSAAAGLQLGAHTAAISGNEAFFATIIEDAQFAATTMTLGGTVAQQGLVTTQTLAEGAQLAATPGYIGPSTSNEIGGSRSKALPTVIQAVSSFMQFITFMSTGGQEIVDLIYNLVSYQDYVLKFNSHGLYSSTIDWESVTGWNGLHRAICDRARYVKGTMQNFDAGIKINNLHRPGTVAIKGTDTANSWGTNTGFNTPGGNMTDVSKYTVGNMSGTFALVGKDAHLDYGTSLTTRISGHYFGLKMNFQNQYGQLDGIKQIPYSCSFHPEPHPLPDDVEITGTDPIADAIAMGYDVQVIPVDTDGDSFPDMVQILIDGFVLIQSVNISQVIWDPQLIPYYFNFQQQTSGIVFGGDAYINRYTEKVIMPFFWDFLKGQPDGFPFDYRLYANVPFPRYWMDSKKYDMSELVSGVTSLDFGAFATGGSGVPSLLHDLDCAGGFGGLAYSGGSGASGGTDDPGLASGAATGANATNPSTLTGSPGPGMSGGGRGGHNSLFLMRNCYMYSHNSGINDIFVESEVNVAFRDFGDTQEKKFYDWVEFTDVDELFHADIIRDGNYYQYDNSLSKNKFFNQLISFGMVQDRDYNPLVAAECFTHYPKRLIYSLRAQKEAKKDYWRVFLPNNYKDFKNKVNVIKPISQSGALILFPHLSPVKFQGVDQLTTDLKTKLTIGDGGLFGNPMQNITNADLPHEYGSCESARSVINTPSGLYYISQAQGKIFHYGGQGLQNIGDKGMKQWLNEYLPSRLLAAFPAIENVDHVVDNPITGIGCQSVYDPNYDIVYFSKRDYEPVNPCIEFDEESGLFLYNATECVGAEQVPVCPPGMVYNPDCPAPGGLGCCEDINIIPAEFVPGEEEIPDTYNCLADIVIMVDFSLSVYNNANIIEQRNILTNLVEQFEDDIINGNVQLTMIGFQDGVMLSGENDSWGNTWIGPNYANNDPNQYYSWINNKTQDTGDNQDYTYMWTQHVPKYQATCGSTINSFLQDWYPNGDWYNEGGNTFALRYFGTPATNLMGAYWWGLRMAYHEATNPRPLVPKKVIMMYDGFHNRGQVKLDREIIHNGWDIEAPLQTDPILQPPDIDTLHLTWTGFAATACGIGPNANGDVPPFYYQHPDGTVTGISCSGGSCPGGQRFNRGNFGGVLLPTTPYGSTSICGCTPGSTQMITTLGGKIYNEYALNGNSTYPGCNYFGYGFGGDCPAYWGTPCCEDYWGTWGPIYFDNNIINMDIQGQIVCTTDAFNWWTVQQAMNWVATNVIGNPIYQDGDNDLQAPGEVYTVFLANPAPACVGSGGDGCIDCLDDINQAQSWQEMDAMMAERRNSGVIGYTQNGVPIIKNMFLQDIHWDMEFNAPTGRKGIASSIGEGLTLEYEDYTIDYLAAPDICTWPDEVNGGTITESEGGYAQWKENNQVLYNNSLATSPSNAFHTAFDTIAFMEILPNMLREFCELIPGSPETEDEWVCPDGCDGPYMDNTLNMLMCDCSQFDEVEFIDDVISVDLDDPAYFNDSSWTLSYDPKIKGWLSFHDWHPDLTFPSHNHFLTTKNVKGVTICEEGFTYNEQTGRCEQVQCEDGYEWDGDLQDPQCCGPTTDDPIVEPDFDSLEDSLDYDNPYATRIIDFDSYRKELKDSTLETMMDSDGKVTLFETLVGSRDPLTAIADQTAHLKIKEDVLKEIINIKPRNLAFDVHFTMLGETKTISLESFNVGRNNFQIALTKETGVEFSPYVPELLSWKIKGDITGVITINKLGDLHGWLRGHDGKQYEIRRVTNDEYALVNWSNLLPKYQSKTYECGNDQCCLEDADQVVDAKDRVTGGVNKSLKTKLKNEVQGQIKRSMAQSRQVNLGCINMAVEIDYTTWLAFTANGLDEQDITEWCAEIIASVSEVYIFDFDIPVMFCFLHIHAMESDYDGIFSRPSYLNIVYNYWNTFPYLSVVDRSVTHIFTTKDLGGGQAYGIGGLCYHEETWFTYPGGEDGDCSYWGCGDDVAAYAVNGVMDMMGYQTPDATDLYVYDTGWNVYEVAHELGHNCGAFHTFQCWLHEKDEANGFAGDGGMSGANVLETSSTWVPNYSGITCNYSYVLEEQGPLHPRTNCHCLNPGDPPMLPYPGNTPGDFYTWLANNAPYGMGETIWHTDQEYATVMGYGKFMVQAQGLGYTDAGDMRFQFNNVTKDQHMWPLFYERLDTGCLDCFEDWSEDDCPEGFIWDPITETCVQIEQLLEGTCNCPEGFQLVFAGTTTPATVNFCLGCAEQGEAAGATEWIAPCVECLGEECVRPVQIIDRPADGGIKGGLWKHNVRCDLYNNYYYIQYPWEIELVESKGQTVEILRSIEYQLESYLYKGKLPNDCGDRFHDLDYNFDEAIIYNTEQVSGVLKLIPTPKNNIPEITTYPIITNEDIEILFSKEEQKYRFDMFWDVTKDRGEFNPNATNTIWKTELNGYIRHLNAENLDYTKARTERKKFRHYFNKVLFRKGVEEHVANAALPPTWQVGNREVNPNVILHTKKMLLRLANTKLNKSFR